MNKEKGFQMAQRRRTPEPPPTEIRQFTGTEIDRGIAKLRRRIDDVNSLDPDQVSFDDAKVQTVQSNIHQTIREVFGTRSPEFAEHQHHDIWHGGYNVMDSSGAGQGKFTQGIPQSVAMLEGLISRLEEKREELQHDNEPDPRSIAPLPDTRRIFVVHGRDEAARETVARYISGLDLEPIILHEKSSQGRTIIEKFEEYADVAFAVVLLTPDDVGRPADESDPSHPRARQNVIFELGYFVGKIGRERVCALLKADVEIPSDYHGVVYLKMDDAGAWKLALAREIHSAGIEVDLNKTKLQ